MWAFRIAAHSLTAIKINRLYHKWGLLSIIEEGPLHHCAAATTSASYARSRWSPNSATLVLVSPSQAPRHLCHWGTIAPILIWLAWHLSRTYYDSATTCKQSIRNKPLWNSCWSMRSRLRVATVAVVYWWKQLNSGNNMFAGLNKYTLA